MEISGTLFKMFAGPTDNVVLFAGKPSLCQPILKSKGDYPQSLWPRYFHPSSAIDGDHPESPGGRAVVCRQ